MLHFAQHFSIIHWIVLFLILYLYYLYFCLCIKRCCIFSACSNIIHWLVTIDWSNLFPIFKAPGVCFFPVWSFVLRQIVLHLNVYRVNQNTVHCWHDAHFFSLVGASVLLWTRILHIAPHSSGPEHRFQWIAPSVQCLRGKRLWRSLLSLHTIAICLGTPTAVYQRFYWTELCIVNGLTPKL